MKKIFLFLFFLSFLSSHLFSQKFTLSGYIEDKGSGEKMISANVYIDSTYTGTTTNAYGFYSMTLSSGIYTIVFSYTGYTPVKKKIVLDKDISMNISMETNNQLEGVEISAQVENIELNTQMSIVKVPIKSIKNLPAIMGETDVLKALQLLPGVQSGTEASSGLYVRGGGPDQNLILLDGAPLYNVSHLFGFFSVFNADAINNVELIKGGFPARYGGRLSSVLNINMKEGNMHSFHGTATIGSIASRLTLEGPIIKNKMSFIISGRRTYADYFIQPLIRLANEYSKQGYYFYDLNIKVNYKISNNDRLYISTYLGKDDFYNDITPYEYLYDGVKYTREATSGFNWGNKLGVLRWNHMFNKKLFANTSVTYSQYDYISGSTEKNSEVNGDSIIETNNAYKYLSGINDFAMKIDFDYLPAPNHYVKFGISEIYHQFHPGAANFVAFQTGVLDIDSFAGNQDVFAAEVSAYIEDDWQINSKFKVNAGLHYSSFFVEKKYYQSLQPRLAVRYLLPGKWALKASYAEMQQYVHLLTNSTMGLPTDLWVPSTAFVFPEKSRQVALGIAKTLRGMYEFSVEGYYKSMSNIIEYKEGASFLGTSSAWEDKIETGKGKSYGAELFLQKNFGLLTGWIGYTWSKTDRQFDNINNGAIFPYKYDRRHDFSLVLNIKLDSIWSISGTWVYGTGNAVTLATVRYLSMDDFINYYENDVQSFNKKNEFRMAAYHRMDIGFKREKQKRWGRLIWNFGVYNVYNRKNPFYYYFGYDSFGNRALKRVSIFPFLPSANLTFEF